MTKECAECSIHINTVSDISNSIKFPWLIIILPEQHVSDMGMGQNLVPLVNIKIAGKWMFIPLKMVLIGIDPYPHVILQGGASRLRGYQDTGMELVILRRCGSQIAPGKVVIW